MGNVSLLSRLPALRLLLPLVAGILFFRATNNLWLPAVLLAVLIAILIAMQLYGKTSLGKLRMRSWRIIPISLAMAIVGWGAAWVAEPTHLDTNHFNGTVACGRIENLKYNEQSMLMQVKLLNVGGNGNTVKGAHILLSTRGCNYDFVAGDLIAFTLEVNRVRNMGNPDEMDYEQYLHDKGIIYRQHVEVREIEKVGESPTFMTRAFNVRSDLQHRVLNSSLSPESQSLIIAMLLGDDDFIEPSMRDSFSRAGVAHVLALSGLHIAVISLIIWFLFFPLDYIRGKKIRLLLTLIALIAYDVLTGLSASVIRSTVMIAFVFMSQIFYRKSSPLNSVAAAALAILVFNPSSLYSVGFQLSFITVSSLIIFYQAFELKHPQNKILNYFYTIIVSSLVAMVTTIILTSYYFNVMSLIAVISNVLIMPFIPVFMVLGAFAILLLAMGGGIAGLSQAIDWIVDAIETIAGWMSTISPPSESVYVTWVAVLVYYSVLILLFLWIYKRNARMLLAAGVVMIIGVVFGLVKDSMAPRRGLVIFNSFNSTPVLYFNGNEALLWVPDVPNDYDVENFKRWNRAFLAHHRIDSIIMVDSAKCQLPGAVFDPPYANVMGTCIMAAGKGKWKNYIREDSVALQFDVALVTKGFHSQISRLKELIICDTIVMSGGIYEEENVTLDRECKSSKIPFYNIKQSGAYQKYY
jgi:competence protein ComEC